MGQSMVQIEEADCTGCDLCILHCPFEALLPRAEVLAHRSKRDVVVLLDACVGCLSCIGSCPTGALTEVTLPLAAEQSPLLLPSTPPETASISRWGRNDRRWA